MKLSPSAALGIRISLTPNLSRLLFPCLLQDQNQKLQKQIAKLEKENQKLRRAGSKINKVIRQRWAHNFSWWFLYLSPMKNRQSCYELPYKRYRIFLVHTYSGTVLHQCGPELNSMTNIYPLLLKLTWLNDSMARLNAGPNISPVGKGIKPRISDPIIEHAQTIGWSTDWPTDRQTDWQTAKTFYTIANVRLMTE